MKELVEQRRCGEGGGTWKFTQGSTLPTVSQVERMWRISITFGSRTCCRGREMHKVCTCTGPHIQGADSSILKKGWEVVSKVRSGEGGLLEAVVSANLGCKSHLRAPCCLPSKVVLRWDSQLKVLGVILSFPFILRDLGSKHGPTEPLNGPTSRDWGGQLIGNPANECIRTGICPQEYTPG